MDEQDRHTVGWALLLDKDTRIGQLDEPAVSRRNVVWHLNLTEGRRDAEAHNDDQKHEQDDETRSQYFAYKLYQGTPLSRLRP